MTMNAYPTLPTPTTPMAFLCSPMPTAPSSAHSPTRPLLFSHGPHQLPVRPSSHQPSPCPSAQPPGAQSHLPVRPASHLICEPYAPLMHGMSQAPSVCLPPSGTLPAPHSLPASLTPPPSCLHTTLCCFYHIWPPLGPYACTQPLSTSPHSSLMPYQHLTDTCPSMPTCSCPYPCAMAFPRPPTMVQTHTDVYLHMSVLFHLSSPPLHVL